MRLELARHILETDFERENSVINRILLKCFPYTNTIECVGMLQEVENPKTKRGVKGVKHYYICVTENGEHQFNISGGKDAVENGDMHYIPVGDNTLDSLETIRDYSRRKGTGIGYVPVPAKYVTPLGQANQSQKHVLVKGDD